MQNKLVHGVVEHSNSDRPTDYFYRISVKGLIRNEKGEVLVVKEAGRTYWDLPGGGMDHGEDFDTAIAREMKEEVNLEGEFTYRIIDVDQPKYSDKNNHWQVRLIFEIIPTTMTFAPGIDSDEIAFIHPDILKEADEETTRLIYSYATKITQ